MDIAIRTAFISAAAKAGFPVSIIAGDETGDVSWASDTPSDKGVAEIMLDALKAVALAEVMPRANRIRDRLLALYPKAVSDSFATREREARAVVTGDLPPSEAVLLMKVYGTHQAVTAAAPRVIEKAEALMDATVAIEKMVDAARTEIAAAESEAALETVIASLKARADAAEQALGG